MAKRRTEGGANVPGWILRTIVTAILVGGSTPWWWTTLHIDRWFNKPQLKVELLGANVFEPDAPDVRGRLTGVALQARTWNVGAPSAATNWQFLVTPSGGSSVSGQLTIIPAQLSLKGEKSSAVITAAQSLETQTSTKEITAIPIQGVLLFYVPLPKAAVIDPSTKWELSLQDVRGNTVSTSQVLGQWLSR